jgi:dynein heavy chain, axonemal
MTQGMQFSLFKEPFKEEIQKWNIDLVKMSDVIEVWTKCQAGWKYLQPIFDSPDIVKQLPQEASRFKSVDALWRSTINQVKDNPFVQQCCLREGLLEKLQGANNNLDLIQKGLNDYLEEKRKVFARFYFLSNDDLLEILSQTKEVENVRPHE